MEDIRMETYRVEKLEIGHPHQGGIIFYLDHTGEHGLIASPYDQKRSIWGDAFGAWLDNTKWNIGAGKENTKIIIARNRTRKTAAQVCAEYSYGEYKDWFLPSLDELQLMRENLYRQKFVKFSNTDYWSSTDADGFRAVGLNFFDGRKQTYWQTDEIMVRAIREF